MVERHDKPTPEQTCVFCGARPTTGEHVFSKWIRKVLPPTNPNMQQRTYNRLRSDGAGDMAQEAGRANGPLSSLQLWVVCASCNTGWMSSLDAKCQKPLGALINGAATALSVAEQSDIASWAVLKAIVVAYASPEVRAATADDRSQLCRTKQPSPDRWSVWLAPSDGIWANQHFLEASGNTFATSSSKPANFDWQSSLFLLRRVFVAVQYCARPGFFRADLREKNGFARIWPHPEEITDWKSLVEFSGPTLGPFEDMIHPADREIIARRRLRPAP